MPVHILRRVLFPPHLLYRGLSQKINVKTTCTEFSLTKENPKPRAAGVTPRTFVNVKRIQVEAGNGGDGCIAFQRLFCNPKAGPSGGDGGNGGHIILQANESVTDLAHLSSKIQAEHGTKGYPNNCHGASGDHMYIQVPFGTLVYSADAVSEPLLHSESNLSSSSLLATIDRVGSLFIAARGGSGGRGNAFLTNSAHVTGSSPTRSDRNAPLRIAERGARGEHGRLILRMSQLANLGLVGIPNAGKSTLLRGLTRARPKVAPYAFTTLKPHLGILSLSENSVEMMVPYRKQNVKIADLPGLIEGAAARNAGLGAEFLSLIADCQLLMYVIDLGTLWVNLVGDHRNWCEVIREQVSQQLVMLRSELQTHDPNLILPERRCFIVGTKLDLILPPDIENQCPMIEQQQHSELMSELKQCVEQASVDAEILQEDVSHDRIILVSARRGLNMQMLVQTIQRYSDTIK